MKGLRDYGPMVAGGGLVCLLALSSAVAHADGTTPDKDWKDAAAVASQFFRAGQAAYDRSEYRAAALAFMEAYRRVPRGAVIYNAGRAWEAAADKEQAADAFARALQHPDFKNDDATFAREHLAALEASLALAEVTGPVGGTVLVSGAERGIIPVLVHLSLGVHEVRVRRRDGTEVSRSVKMSGPGERISIALEDSPAPPQATAPLTAPVPDRAPGSLRTGMWISIGAAAVLTGVGIYSYARFVNGRSAFEQGGSHDGSLRDDAQRWRTSTYVFWGGAAVAAFLGGVLFVVSSDANPRARSPVGELRIGTSGASGILR